MTKSRGLEKDGRRERILGLRRGAAVQSFVREGPCLLGIFARSQAGREYLARCDWRRETNRNPTFSGRREDRQVVADASNMILFVLVGVVMAVCLFFGVFMTRRRYEETGRIFA